MRILFDSKKAIFKTPFGTLTPGQECTLNLHIPVSVKAKKAVCILRNEDGAPYADFSLTGRETGGDYEIFTGTFSLDQPGLYFYHFEITGKTGAFRLFKQEDETNMEEGDLWQVTCTPSTFTTPDWAKGGIIYQIFPDRFCRSGHCDLTGKQEPYILHADWNEEVFWQPDEQGEILNNDFYGGNFRGITEKMEYLASLGVTLLYLNPIGKSFSSHRYDTGDYKTPDPMLGTTADFSAMCDEAHRLGIRVILDGVFSHTGSDSLYFNKNGTFGGIGAYQSPDSPYYSWYTFTKYPDKYKSWWDFDTLPTVNKLDPAFIEYIITGENSVIAHWLKLGADGFRLDVADELPNEFMAILKTHLRRLRPDALLMGEVWEDASNKVAYGVRCRYFADGTLDSVMNYPFRTAILDFVRGQDDGEHFRNAVLTIAENYPPQVLRCNMNMLGTHDTPRILTALVDEFDGSREVLAQRHLTDAQTETAVKRLKLATFLQYMLPGSPSIYYGDEAQMEGHKDPFNRRTYPWGNENKDLIAHYRALGQLRKDFPALALGDIRFVCAQGGRLCFTRTYSGETLRVYVNQRDVPWQLPKGNALFARNFDGNTLSPMGYCLVKE